MIMCLFFYTSVKGRNHEVSLWHAIRHTKRIHSVRRIHFALMDESVVERKVKQDDALREDSKA